jgi:protein-S-isoprenylcysteine O-methyltransferase Ste14
MRFYRTISVNTKITGGIYGGRTRLFFNPAYPVGAAEFLIPGSGVPFPSLHVFRFSHHRLRFYDVSLQLSEEPTSLVTSGPFRFSRNPIYLGMASVLLGVAVLMGTLVTLAFPVIFVTLIEFFIIPGEERKLEKLFGEPYREYKKSVRRWI